LKGVVASQHVLERRLTVVAFRLLGASLARVILVVGTPVGPAIISSLGGVHGRFRYWGHIGRGSCFLFGGKGFFRALGRIILEALTIGFLEMDADIVYSFVGFGLVAPFLDRVLE
jgi:hypothetical protein